MLRRLLGRQRVVFAAVAAALCLGLVGLVHHLQWQAEASWLPPANAASLLPARLPLPDMDPHEPPLSVPPGYVPVRLGPPAGARTQVQLCRPDFAAYSREPWRYPMFRDLAATCSPADTIARTLQQLAMQFAAAPPPAGLVFHQSRVGSTLLCNLLAADAQALVYAEAGVPAQIVAHCTDCTPDTQVAMLRILLAAMGNVPGKERVFFKLQSANTAYLHIFRKAFPTVPFIFVYRNPVEILVSQFMHDAARPDQLAAIRGRPPCARTMAQPPTAVKALLSQRGGGAARISTEHYCAAYLAHLGQVALTEQGATPLGVVVNYKDLPEVFISTILPNHFGVKVGPELTEKMHEYAKVYSKSRRSDTQSFDGDSERKAEKSTAEIDRWAETYMGPVYKELEERYQKYLVEKPKTELKPPPVVSHDHQPRRGSLLDVNSWFGRADSLPPGTVYSQEMYIKEYLPFPQMQPLSHFLSQWPPDEPDPPNVTGIAEGTLQRFDYSDPVQRAEADRLRLHEVPFMLYNVPDIEKARKLWADDEYLKKRFGHGTRSVTVSDSNHFMYYHKGKADMSKGYKPPTRTERMTFSDWLKKAYAAEKASKDDVHFYLQLNSVPPDEWINDDLPLFKPRRSFFIVEPHANRGINCRFGARGIISEAHYDGGRNFIAMIRGAKRYIILPPSECQRLYLYERGHPEARHSVADWSEPDYERFPLLKDAKAAQVIIRAGEVLYLPSYWFHYIVATGFNIQCNSRSGNAIRGRQDIESCGFY